MLITCPECNSQISNKALSCPHCGYPIVKTNTHKRKSKRMKLPNGFGQITEIKNKRLRNPFRVMINNGFDEYGKPKTIMLKPISYFKTYNEAYEALIEYHKNPYDKNKDMTMIQLFDIWIGNCYDPKINIKMIKCNKSLFKKVKKIYDVKVIDVKPLYLKNFIEDLEVSADSKVRLKNIFNQMFDYALSLEIIDKNVSRIFELSNSIKLEQKSNKISHKPFTNEEITILWNNVNKYPFVKNILIGCFMGWRPGEMCGIKRENVDIQNMIITGGCKTESGKNRRVPIHSCIRKFILEKYNSNNTMFTTYKYYREHFIETINILGLDKNHTPHDCRSTFITYCKKYNVDEYAIKRMVGHSINDVTEKVYTKRSDEWLKNEIEKIELKNIIV